MPSAGIKATLVPGMEFPKPTPELLQRLAANIFHQHMLDEWPGRHMGPLEMYDEEKQDRWRNLARAAYVTLAVEAGAEAEELPDDDPPPTASIPESHAV